MLSVIGTPQFDKTTLDRLDEHARVLSAVFRRLPRRIARPALRGPVTLADRIVSPFQRACSFSFQPSSDGLPAGLLDRPFEGRLRCQQNRSKPASTGLLISFQPSSDGLPAGLLDRPFEGRLRCQQNRSKSVSTGLLISFQPSS